MKIIQKNKHVIDVFIGNGWENWSRFAIERGFPRLVSGAPLTQKDFSELRHALVQETKKR